MTLIVNAELNAQPQRFIIKPASFSSRINDEFSPVFYKGGIVFCSNQSDGSVVGYKDDQNRLFNIFYVTRKGTGWSYPKIFAKEIKSGFNDGPVTFNCNGDIMYYSRNNSIENHLRNISDNSNKLGIYSAELLNGKWTNIRPFRYNNPEYTFCTPALTPDGDRIYFASDMPGGSGGMDLYYCNRKNNDWDQPVNLGPVINTIKNESFPFACKYGKLYFASDGHKGFGGKDLFYTQEINGKWIVPVNLDSTINSASDDFGIVIDSTFENGYFSTNRRKTDDIFSFSSPSVVFSTCDTIKENNYCFTFYDEQHQANDTVPVVYQWDFGDGIIRTGAEVKHCFPGPGDYAVKLSITDKLTGNIISKQAIYKAELENQDQAYINSGNIGIVNELMPFEGVTADLKGLRITDYFWDFGDGFKQGGPNMNKTFNKDGEYIVRLGLIAKKDSMGIVPGKCFLKKIKVFDSYRELKLKREKTEEIAIVKRDSANTKLNTLQTSIYLMDDLYEKQKVKISEGLMELGKSSIRFDKFGIIPSSFPFLEKIAGILAANPDIRLDVVLYPIEDETGGNKMTLSQMAQELTFYFKTKEINKNAIHVKGLSLPMQIFKPPVPDNKTVDGSLELIFMKN